MVRIMPALLVAALLAGAGPQARAAAPIAITCRLGSTIVNVTSDGADLVYRYGVPGKPPELVLRGNAKSGNLLFLHDGGRRSEYQQLRFVNGGYSYVLASLFVAPDYSGKGAIDRLRFFILNRSRVIQTHVCRGAGSMENNALLDALPKDPLPAVDPD